MINVANTCAFEIPPLCLVSYCGHDERVIGSVSHAKTQWVYDLSIAALFNSFITVRYIALSYQRFSCTPRNTRPIPMSTLATTPANARTTLNDDLYSMIIAQQDKTANWKEIQQLSMVCRSFRRTVAPLLFEKLRYHIDQQWNSSGHSRRSRRSLRRVGRHVR
jgi:hypothetical protein